MMDWPADPLWHKLRAMQIEPPGAALSFALRLAGENGWTRDFADEVFAEYRRFLYLAAIVREPMTPSVAVDQAWHLHLSYTRHYWDILCGEILGRPLHHEPTQGGPDEAERYRRQYERTLAAYCSLFGSEPPPSIWPDVESRFASRMCWVDRAKMWVVPQNLAVRTGSGLFLATILTAYTVLNEAGPVQDTFVLLYLGAFFMISLTMRRRRKRGRDEEFEFEWPDFSGGEGGAGCGGGCGGCGG